MLSVDKISAEDLKPEEKEEIKSVDKILARASKQGEVCPQDIQHMQPYTKMVQSTLEELERLMSLCSNRLKEDLKPEEKEEIKKEYHKAFRVWYTTFPGVHFQDIMMTLLQEKVQQVEPSLQKEVGEKVMHAPFRASCSVEKESEMMQKRVAEAVDAELQKGDSIEVVKAKIEPLSFLLMKEEEVSSIRQKVITAFDKLVEQIKQDNKESRKQEEKQQECKK